MRARLGQGITDAFRDAELVAEAIDAGFSGRLQMEETLENYEPQRNTATMPKYELNSQLASLEPPPPEMQHLFAALCGNQVEPTGFFGTLAGTVSIPEFYSPQNIQRIVAGASPLPLLPGHMGRVVGESHSLHPAA